MAPNRGHAASATRTVAGGLSVSAALGIVATLAASAPQPAQPAAVPTSPAAPRQIVIVKRRYIQVPAGAATPPAPSPPPRRPAAAAPRPRPAPRTSARTSGS